jgi:carboxyl-terminal processing protease
MVNNLDEYSHYFPPEEYTQIRKRTDRWSVGAGLQISDNKIITNIVPHGPASIAGLMVGDKIQRIDGQSVANGVWETFDTHWSRNLAAAWI